MASDSMLRLLIGWKFRSRFASRASVLQCGYTDFESADLDQQSGSKPCRVLQRVLRDASGQGIRRPSISTRLIHSNA